jgi:hypothetical protein
MKSDRPAALAALEDERALSGVPLQRQQAISAVMKTDPSRGLQLMKSWGVRGVLPDLTPVGTWAQSDPHAAAQSVIENLAAYGGQEAMKLVGKAWAASDPQAALLFAKGRHHALGTMLAQSVITQWAERDPAAALSYVTAQSSSAVRAQLGPPLVESWAKTDPLAALQWADENLSGEARAGAAASAIKTMAAKDIDAASRAVAGLEPGPMKNRAVVQLMDTWLTVGSDTKDVKTTAAAALTWMAALPEAEVRKQAFGQASWRLFSNDRMAKETAAILSGEQGASMPAVLFEHAAQYLAKANPESAMSWADGLPGNHTAAARRNVLSEWLGSRPEAAAAWVRNLPPGAERTASIRFVTQRLESGSAAQTQQWIDSLPAEDRAAAHPSTPATVSK